MNNLYLNEDQIMDFELLKERSIQNYFNTNIVLYYVLEGEMTLSAGGETFSLKRGDFIVMNAFWHHSYQMTEHFLVMGFVISVAEMGKYYELDNVKIQCNTTIEEPKQYENVQRLLEACIRNYYGKRSGNGRILVHLNGIYYQLMEALMLEHAVYIVNDTGQFNPSEDDVRVDEILNYIHRNFKNQISLKDLADRFYMSTSYISRYIKKKLGENFGGYLTGLRLNASVRELKDKEKSVARIAMDNGFPNIASFNKAFKERYGMSPKAFRETQGQTKEQEVRESMANELEYRLLDYFEHETVNQNEKEENVIYKDLKVDTQNVMYMEKSWNKMINIGRVVSLLRRDVQEHLLFLHRKLGFEYVRMWDLYDEEIKMNAGVDDGRHNFSKLDKVLDFLVEHQMRPYFELGFKPNILMLSSYIFLHNEPREILFQSADSLQRFFTAMMVHFVNRYGRKEVSKWYFEQWCDPRLFDDENGERYFQVFEETSAAIKAIVPETRVGGAFDREYECIDFESLIAQWSRRMIQPDFLGIYGFQTKYREEEVWQSLHNMAHGNISFLEEYLSDKKQIVEKYDMNVPLIISEWNMTVVNRNVVNDSCHKGTYIMDVLMRIHNMADMVGYWFGTDLFVETEESPNVLDGCCGLISYHGICKPAFYAIEFLNRMGDYLLGRQEDLMVTMDGYDNYMIACCNHKNLDIQYYMQEERDLGIQQVSMLYTDSADMRIHVKIDNVKNGFYHVKVRSISSKHGSVQDEWYRMGLIENLNAQDIDYLRRISTPRISIYEYVVSNHVLEINIALNPHEMQYVHIFRQIKEQEFV